MDLEIAGIIGRFSDAMSRGGISEVASLVKAERSRLESVTVHVAVTGTPRAGKSAFINSVMGFKDGEDGAAPTGPAQQVTKPAPYSRPGNPSSVFWELPSVRGPGLVGRLPEGGGDRQVAALASELRRVGKQFYLIRTKIDLGPPGYREKEFVEDVLNVFTADHFANLDIEYAIAHFFCVSCHQVDRFDFLECVQALQRNSSPPLQKHALLLSLHYLANKMELKDSLREFIPVSAIYSCLINPIPVEQLPYQANVHFLYNEIRLYRVLLELDYPALRKRAKLIRRPTFVLSDEIQTTMAKMLTEKGVSEELLKWTEINVSVPHSYVKWVPFLEALPGGKLSGASTIRLLDTMLQKFTDDACRVQRKMEDGSNRNRTTKDDVVFDETGCQWWWELPSIHREPESALSAQQANVAQAQCRSDWSMRSTGVRTGWCRSLRKTETDWRWRLRGFFPVTEPGSGEESPEREIQKLRGDRGPPGGSETGGTDTGSG
ncbi:interferon-inducible GTPase 5-like, partial [Cetorhinus maximus]